jgi:hypothetical protein
MFSIPQGDATVHEGAADDDPIRLDGVPVAEFEALLFILYPVFVPSLSCKWPFAYTRFILLEILHLTRV